MIPDGTKAARDEQGWIHRARRHRAA